MLRDFKTINHPITNNDSPCQRLRKGSQKLPFLSLFVVIWRLLLVSARNKYTLLRKRNAIVAELKCYDERLMYIKVIAL